MDQGVIKNSECFYRYSFIHDLLERLKTDLLDEYLKKQFNVKDADFKTPLHTK